MKDRLVTLVGGGGFVGRYVAQALLAAGARVRVAQPDPREAWFLKPLGELGQTQFVAADVLRPETIARAVQGARHVVNLAGSFSVDPRIHVDGARNVAEAAKAAGVESLVHISAIVADAGSPSRYASAKAAGEAAVRAAFPHAAILRPATVFGREDRFTNRLACMIQKLPVVPVFRAGTRTQPVFAGDVAAAVIAALGAGEARTYDVAGPDVLTMAELHQWIARTIGRDRALPALPDALGGLVSAFGFLPGAPLTGEEWKLLQRDAVASADMPGLAALGVTPTPLATAAPAWLVCYRRAGRFATLAGA